MEAEIIKPLSLDGHPDLVAVRTGNVTVMPVKEFAGEHRRAGPLYTAFLWLVSLLSLVSNIVCILSVWVWRAAVRKDPSFSRALWLVGRSPKHYSSPFVDWFSRYNHRAKVHAAGCVALDIFYNYHENVRPELRNNIEGWTTKFWVGRMENRQAVTNRRKIVTKLLMDAFRQFPTRTEIRLVSVASGSAQAVIDAMLQVPHLNVKVKLLDVDKAAIEASKRRVRDVGLEDKIEIIRGTTKALESACKDFQPHIIEMVGFLDYRPDDKAVQLIERIKKQLVPGGIFITCNINRNREKVFLDWVLLWPMIYRTPAKFRELLLQGGFEEQGIRLYSCPFKIHTLAVCGK